LLRRLAAGFGAQGLAIVVRLAQQFVMVPLFLRAWDAAIYQDWLLLTAGTSFLVLIDLGLRHYMANLMLIAWSKGDAPTFHHTLHVGLGIYAGILLLAAPAVALAAWFAIAQGWLDFGAAASDAALLAVVGMAAYTLVAMPIGLVFSVYAARGDTARGINLATASTVIETVAVGWALWLGVPAAAVALVYLIAMVAFGAGLWIDLGRRYPDIRIRAALPTRSDLAQNIPRAIDYVVIPLAQSAVLQGTVLILGALAGKAAAPVVVFTTLRTLANLVRQVVNQAGQVTSIELTRFHAQGDRARLERLYLAGARLLCGAGGLLAGAVLAVAPFFLAIWTRGKVEYDGWAFAGLLAAVVLTLPGQLAMLLLYASNQPRALTAATVAQGLIGLAASVPAAYWGGAAGVAWALAATECATIGLLPWQVARAMNLPARRLVTIGWAAAAAGLALGYGAAFVGLALLGGQGLGRLMLVGLLWCALVAVPAYFLFIDAADRRRLRDRLAAVRGSRFDDR
jgi:O-antigen/teichoic acid export membrane protein